MSYHDMYSQDDVFGKIPSRANSETLSRILISTDDINRQLSNGTDPIELSILKWERVKDAYKWTKIEAWRWLYYGDIFEKIRSDTCPLCIIALKDFENEFGNQKHIKDKCTKCKLAQIEFCPDIDSLFSNITYLLGYVPPIKNGTPKLNLANLNDDEQYNLLGEYIDEMIERLKSLE